MGCYNTTGFVSGLNVRCSDPIVAIPCVIEGSGKYNPNNYYTTSQLRPISLPLFGKYDDYGSIEDIEDTPSGKLFYMTTDDTTTGTASPDINQILSDDEAVKRMIKSVKLYKSH